MWAQEWGRKVPVEKRRKPGQHDTAELPNFGIWVILKAL